ncbi:molybdopterin molybdotransferase MoeA [Maridesulfovibrio sp.]|uniref:molybdopterin molybdotransferase MoeA n=1 Tax=Maridesulfovibrio sp. TaxID=2795000 RepID=UPI002A186FFE|nr:molybdopterin molybdotransferase MoeA [Maridesulfovibrio sp.]
MHNDNKPDFPLSIPRSEALFILRACISPVRETNVSVTECSGRISAESVVSGVSLPDHDRSAMDGFAVPSAETAAATEKTPVTLSFGGEIRPSETVQSRAREKCAIRVLTGGIVPSGTDAVIPFEKVHVREDLMTIFGPARKGDFIRSTGSDIMKGEPIVDAGSEISPCDAALLAYAGIRTVSVRRRLAISVLAVGNELCDPAMENVCGLIPADNLILLKSLCARAGIDNVKIAPCPNSPEAIAAAVNENSACDLIITTGGTGPGNRDFVFNAVRSAGGTPVFKGLAMHPAKSVFACKTDSSVVIGLPGPPNAVNLAFHTIIRPVINILLGARDISPMNTVLLKGPVKGAKDREKMRPCLISEIQGQLIADPLTSAGLSPRKVMSMSNGIIVLPPGCGELQAGETAAAIRYDRP